MDKIIFMMLLQLVWLAPRLGEASAPAAAATSAKAASVPTASKPPAPAATSAPAPGATTAASVAVLPPSATPAGSYTTYTYYGDRYRDPFIPLTGEYRNDQGNDRPPQISSLLLKGIIQDAGSRMALLTSGVSSYILRGGRLYDGRNHLMKGISGVIKTDSVVLMGSDRTIRELKVVSTL